MEETKEKVESKKKEPTFFKSLFREINESTEIMIIAVMLTVMFAIYAMAEM